MAVEEGAAQVVGSLLTVGERVVGLARKRGADAADLLASRSTDFEVKVAEGEIVTLTQAITKGLGLRVFVGGRLGFCTTSDFGDDSLEHAVNKAIELARESAVDEHNGLAPAAVGRRDASPELELYDPSIPALPAETKITWAHELERAARAADPRVTRFRDSGVASGEAVSVLVTSAGVVRTMQSTGISLWCNPIAVHDGELQTEVWFDSRTHLADLEAVESVGKTAGRRAARMLGAKPVKTQRVPVIFEPAQAAGLLSGMLPAIDGDMVHKRASFLADALGTGIANPGLSLIDDPLLQRGVGSAPFDAEGLPTQRRAIIDHGRLTTFLYDSYTARKTGNAPTASARRSWASLPCAGPFNLHVAAGPDDPEAIVRRSERALIVTRGLGRGLNTVSGEYSRGANGLWVEHGEVVHPVQEVTIAGEFLTMLKGIDRIGADLEFRGAAGAPTLRVAEMMVSGS
ncbi:MAG: TldD/PmbA family protein [Deltaproteobacteria bacterium]|nr:TldD/PmbA family protein [Deltaproteobacteria bacterium]